MKRFLTLLFFLLASLAVSFYPRVRSQMKMPPQERPVMLMTGLGNHHHAVKTGNPQAQSFFDQGLRLVYAFNHEEAVRSFRRAAELDPQMAMAYRGIAYALGPNINLDVDPHRERAAYEAVKTALFLSSNGPENERALELLRKAVEMEDALAYDEPPGWFLLVRESMGGALLLNRDYHEAERVFRADLQKNPRSGRSLFGLREALRAQGKPSAAAMLQAGFNRAWRNADVQLRIEDL